jgi:hypothetical protein
MSKADKTTDTGTVSDSAATGTASTRPGGAEGKEGAHTELRPAGDAPRPRSRLLPPEIEDEPGEDDPFNDVPI